MKKMIAVLLMVGLYVSGVQAQNSPFDDQLPANPEPGKCYVKCITPDVYRNETVTVLVKPEYKVLKVVPATYRTVTETVLVKEATKSYKYIPAVYETETVSYIEKPSGQVSSVVPARFGTDSETIETKPEVSRWEYSPYPNCKSENPGDCNVLCWKQYPAEFVTVPTTPKTAPATTTQSPFNEIVKTYTKRVIKTPARVEETVIPEETATITKRVVDTPERIEEQVVPAVYKDVTIQVLAQKGGVHVWEEVDCGLVSGEILPIYWNLGSATLTAEAKRIIDTKLYQYMISNPNQIIEVSSHTDSRGTAESNYDLSERRAQAVVNYLIAKGINDSRLVAKGWGEERLLNKCSDGVTCTEAEHKINRRTEFRVVSQ